MVNFRQPVDGHTFVIQYYDQIFGYIDFLFNTKDGGLVKRPYVYGADLGNQDSSVEVPSNGRRIVTLWEKPETAVAASFLYWMKVDNFIERRKQSRFRLH